MRSADRPGRRHANVGQRREAARMVEFLAQSGHPKKLRKPASLEEYESHLRLAAKDERAKDRKG